MEALALADSPLPRRLRVGVFADARLQPRWIVEAFDKLPGSDFAEVVLVEVRAAPQPPADLLWSLYGALDRRLFGADPSERVDLGLALKSGARGGARPAVAPGA